MTPEKNLIDPSSEEIYDYVYQREGLSTSMTM